MSIEYRIPYDKHCYLRNKSLMDVKSSEIK